MCLYLDYDECAVARRNGSPTTKSDNTLSRSAATYDISYKEVIVVVVVVVLC